MRIVPGWYIHQLEVQVRGRVEILNSILLFLLEYQNLPLPVVTRAEESGGGRREPPRGEVNKPWNPKKKKGNKIGVIYIFFFFQFKIITKFDYAFEAMHAMFLVIEIALSWI